MFISELACTGSASICTEDICTYSGEQPPYADGSGKMHLVNNPNAKDPTWQELKTFIIVTDDTDRLTYVNPSFTCSDFAEQVHDNAEKAGIKAALVLIKFNDSATGHALNVFNTTDMGLVYIDCTGGALSEHMFANSSASEWANVIAYCGWDKVAYLEIGKEYGVTSLTVSTDCVDYQCYETYNAIFKQTKADFDALQQQCNKGWWNYTARLAELNVYLLDHTSSSAYSTYYGAYASASFWENQLERKKRALDTQLQLLDVYGNESYLSKIYIQQQCNKEWEAYTACLKDYNDGLIKDWQLWGGYCSYGTPYEKTKCQREYTNASKQVSELEVEKRTLDAQLQLLKAKGDALRSLGYLWSWEPLGNVSRIMIYW